MIKEAEIQAAMRGMFDQLVLLTKDTDNPCPFASYEDMIANSDPKDVADARSIVLAGLQAAKDARSTR